VALQFELQINLVTSKLRNLKIYVKDYDIDGCLYQKTLKRQVLSFSLVRWSNKVNQQQKKDADINTDIGNVKNWELNQTKV
jgi:hypothetical protein